jgi:hypothetical protein
MVHFAYLYSKPSGFQPRSLILIIITHSATYRHGRCGSYDRAGIHGVRVRASSITYMPSQYIRKLRELFYVCDARHDSSTYCGSLGPYISN